MALEELLAENNTLLKEHNSLLSRVLAIAPAGKAAAAAPKATSTDDGEGGEATETPKRRGRPPKDTSTTSKKPTIDTAKTLASGWMNEIEVVVDEDGEPEESEANAKAMKKRANRKAFLKKCLDKLGAANLAELSDDDDIAKFVKWVEMKKGGEDPFETDDV